MRISDFIIKSGRALMYPIYKGAHERQDGLEYTYAAPTRAYANYVIRWMSDLRRSIDYLLTRDDIDAEKLAYYGFSWGGRLGSIALAMEERLRLGIFLDGGFSPLPSLPEVTDSNFAPRVKVPVLMINGRDDVVFPLETSQKTLLERSEHRLSTKSTFSTSAVSCRPRGTRRLLETPVAAVLAEHDVIEKRDPEHAPRFRKAPRELTVLPARDRVARRMVVADHDRGRRLENGVKKDFPWMNKRAVERAGRDYLVRQWPIAGVEREHGELFPR